MSLTPKDRYLFKPFRGSSHSWAIESFSLLTEDSRVLDVGPGAGIMGSILKERGFEQLFAVEIDEDARKHIKPIYKQVEAELTPFEGEKFDLILLLDVLEHMSDPVAFYARVSKLLNADGIILISVPNIAHWSVRFPLLFGYFNYTERGILDKTHLQFFTLSRFRELIRSNNRHTIIRMGASIEPVELLLPRWIWKNPLFSILSGVRIWIANLLPGLMAFQHLGAVRLTR